MFSCEMQRISSSDRELLTLPGVSRIYGIGVKALRRAAGRGDFPIYAVGTSWPRVRRSEFESWIASTRVSIPKSDREPREM